MKAFERLLLNTLMYVGVVIKEYIWTDNMKVTLRTEIIAYMYNGIIADEISEDVDPRTSEATNG